MKKNLLSLIIFLSLSMVTFGVSAFDGSTPINWEVSGTIANVQFAIPLPTGGFGLVPGVLIDIFPRGAPGEAHITVAGIPGEPILTSTAECGNHFMLPFVNDDLVATFADQSMLFATLDPALGGWVCLFNSGASAEPLPPAVFHLEITGGTGRYEGVTGQLTGTFMGILLGTNASGALLAETGTIVGTINR